MTSFRLWRAHQALLNHSNPTDLERITTNLDDTSPAYIHTVIKTVVGESLTPSEECAILYAWMVDSKRVDPTNFISRDYNLKAWTMRGLDPERTPDVSQRLVFLQDYAQWLTHLSSETRQVMARILLVAWEEFPNWDNQMFAFASRRGSRVWDFELKGPDQIETFRLKWKESLALGPIAQMASGASMSSLTRWAQRLPAGEAALIMLVSCALHDDNSNEWLLYALKDQSPHHWMSTQPVHSIMENLPKEHGRIPPALQNTTLQTLIESILPSAEAHRFPWLPIRNDDLDTTRELVRTYCPRSFEFFEMLGLSHQDWNNANRVRKLGLELNLGVSQTIAPQSLSLPNNVAPTY